MRTILSDQLKVTIDEPSEVYRSSRFDWSGQISQISFNGHTFCTTEFRDPLRSSKGGIGLCNEFGINKPLGYDECEVGNYFPKIGVGLLLKANEEPYHFFRDYEVKPSYFEIAQPNPSELVITSKLDPTNGYAYLLTKRFAVSENCLTLSYLLENIGERTIDTDEYVHNFLGFDDFLVDRDYKLIFPQPIDLNKMKHVRNPKACFKIKGNVMIWEAIPESDFSVSDFSAIEPKMNTWSLEHTGANIGISERVDFEPSRFNLWGHRHVISPEIFKKISLEPNSKMIWERVYNVYPLS
jgi:hypothetical protein